MEQKIKSGDNKKNTTSKKINSFLVINILLLVILPVFSITYDVHFENETFEWLLIGKWFIFWAVGMRLFVAGVRQSSNPEYTATKIFDLKSAESFVVIRELGFANISLGVMGILSVINNHWRLIAGITGCLFFGLAAMQHLFKKPDSRNEIIATIGDLFIFIILLIYLYFDITAYRYA